MHGEYKTPGGKLVVVDFDIVDQRLTNVAITGDFFLYPDEVLDAIRDALTGLPSSVQSNEIARAIYDALPSGASLVGFSPEAIAIAVERGLNSAD